MLWPIWSVCFSAINISWRSHRFYYVFYRKTRGVRLEQAVNKRWLWVFTNFNCVYIKLVLFYCILVFQTETGVISKYFKRLCVYSQAFRNVPVPLVLK